MLLETRWVSGSRGKLRRLSCGVCGVCSHCVPRASSSQAWLGSQRGLLLCRWCCHASVLQPLLDSHDLYVQELCSSQVRIKLFLCHLLLTIWNFIGCPGGKQTIYTADGSGEWFQRCLAPPRSISSQQAKRQYGRWAISCP